MAAEVGRLARGWWWLQMTTTTTMTTVAEVEGEEDEQRWSRGLAETETCEQVSRPSCVHLSEHDAHQTYFNPTSRGRQSFPTRGRLAVIISPGVGAGVSVGVGVALCWRWWYASAR